MLSQNNRS